jgi:hypothetical protein
MWSPSIIGNSQETQTCESVKRRNSKQRNRHWHATQTCERVKAMDSKQRNTHWHAMEFASMFV